MCQSRVKALFLSSASATTTDISRGYARWHLNEPLRFSVTQTADRPLSWGGVQSSVYPSLALHDLSYINFFINVSASLGNNTLTYSDDPADEAKYICTIPDGCYDIVSFNDAVKAFQLSVAGGGVHAFDLKPNYSTGKIHIEFILANYYLNFPATSILLGFTGPAFYPASKISAVDQIEEAPAVARFNVVESLFIHSNLTNNAISGVMASNVIFQSIPNVSIGYSQRDEPSNLIWIPAEVLAGSVNEIIIEIKDQLGRSVNLSENFNLTLLVRY